MSFNECPKETMGKIWLHEEVSKFYPAQPVQEGSFAPVIRSSQKHLRCKLFLWISQTIRVRKCMHLAYDSTSLQKNYSWILWTQCWTCEWRSICIPSLPFSWEQAWNCWYVANCLQVCRCLHLSEVLQKTSEKIDKIHLMAQS